MLIYSISAYLKYKKTRLKQNWLLFLFFSYYFIYIGLNIVNVLLIDQFRLAGLGISIFGLTFGNLALYRFSKHIFFPGDYKRNVFIKSRYRVHLIVGLLSAIAYAAIPYIHHGYEESGKTLPIYVVFLSLPLVVTYLGVFIGLFIQINKTEKKIIQLPENQLPVEKREKFHFKVVRMKTACVFFSLMFILLYLDAFSSLRTILAVFGWILMFLGLTIIHYGLLMPVFPKNTN